MAKVQCTSWSSSETRLGGRLIHFFRFCKMYVEYCDHFDETRHVLSHKRLRSYVKQIQLLGLSGGNDPSHFLIMPIQRIPRYEMLVLNLLKFTQRADPNLREHPDVADLSAALHEIKTVNQYVNRAMEEKKKDKLFQEIVGSVRPGAMFSHLDSVGRLLTPHRVLLHEGMLTLTNRQRRKSRKAYYFVLVTDSLLYFTKKHSFLPAYGSTQHNYKSQLPIE